MTEPCEDCQNNSQQVAVMAGAVGVALGVAVALFILKRNA